MNSESGFKISLAPEIAPTNNKIPTNKIIKPHALKNRCHDVASAGSESNAFKKIPQNINNNAHTKIQNIGDNNGRKIHKAIANIITPKNFLTCNIQTPVFGSNDFPAMPTAINGTPIPSDKQNNATPPKIAFPLCPMYNKAPANGAATQGLTTNADKTPIIKMLFLALNLFILLILFCQLLGNCNS